MKKQILLTLGTLGTLAGASFAIVSCANNESEFNINKRLELTGLIMSSFNDLKQDLNSVDSFINFFNEKKERNVILLWLFNFKITFNGSSNYEINTSQDLNLKYINFVIKKVEVKKENDQTLKFIFTPKKGLTLVEKEILVNFSDGAISIPTSDTNAHIGLSFNSLSNLKESLSKIGLDASTDSKDLLSYNFSDKEINSLIKSLNFNTSNKKGQTQYSGNQVLDKISFTKSKNNNVNQAKNNFVLNLQYKEFLEDENRTYNMVPKQTLIEIDGASFQPAFFVDEFNENKLNVFYDKKIFLEFLESIKKIKWNQEPDNWDTLLEKIILTTKSFEAFTITFEGMKIPVSHTIPNWKDGTPNTIPKQLSISLSYNVKGYKISPTQLIIDSETGEIVNL